MLEQSQIGLANLSALDLDDYLADAECQDKDNPIISNCFHTFQSNSASASSLNSCYEGGTDEEHNNTANGKAVVKRKSSKPLDS
jgi:hypothetical protein